jgi:hypothetical protein
MASGKGAKRWNVFSSEDMLWLILPTNTTDAFAFIWSYGINNRFAHYGLGNIPYISAADLRKVCSAHSVFFNELNNTFIRKMLFKFFPKKQHLSDGWDKSSLCLRDYLSYRGIHFLHIKYVIFIR